MQCDLNFGPHDQEINSDHLGQPPCIRSLQTIKDIERTHLQFDLQSRDLIISSVGATIVSSLVIIKRCERKILSGQNLGRNPAVWP